MRWPAHKVNSKVSIVAFFTKNSLQRITIAFICEESEKSSGLCNVLHGIISENKQYGKGLTKTFALKIISLKN
jgi:hypothetical protein